MLYTTELSRKWAFIWYFSGFSGASWFCKHFDSLLILSHFGGLSRNYHQFLSNVIPTLTWQNTNYSIIDDSSQWNPPHNHKLLLASMHRYIRTAPASKHECPHLGKHPSSMQTVECLQNQDAPENPEKYQMKAHIPLNSVVYNIVPFYVLFIVHSHFSFCDW
jgi:hypothetical protein